MKTFWLSYAGDDGFRGAVIIDGESFLLACANSKQRGFSPGGQVAGIDLDPFVATLVPTEYKNRLLDKRDVDALEVVMEKRIGQAEAS